METNKLQHNTRIKWLKWYQDALIKTVKQRCNDNNIIDFEDILNEEIEYDPQENLIREKFRSRVNNIRTNSASKLLEFKRSNKVIIGYGAAAKSTVFLNFCDIGSDLLEFVVDGNPDKIGKFIPGVDIKISSLAEAISHQPDAFLIFAWNLADEIKILINSNFERSIENFVAIPSWKKL